MKIQIQEANIMSTDYDFKFGKNLRAIRMACKLTQEEFSRKLNDIGYDLTTHVINEIESGKRYVYPHELKSFHLALGVPYEKLLP